MAGGSCGARIVTRWRRIGSLADAARRRRPAPARPETRRLQGARREAGDRITLEPLIHGQHPEAQVQLQLTVDPPPLTQDAFDVCLHFGEPPDARVIARLIASNRRLLCASPAYLAKHGTPRPPHDLAQHRCILIRQGEQGYGVWRLTSGRRTQTVKVRGPLSTNDGEMAVNWALAGHGIVMRAEWDIARSLRSGRLRQVLESWQTPPADIYAVYPQRHPRVDDFAKCASRPGEAVLRRSA